MGNFQRSIMPIPTHLYRHDSIILPRPYACDVDPEGWLWQGTTHDRLLGHNLKTAELRVVIIPEMEGKSAFSAFAWQDKVFMLLGECDFYLVYDPFSGQTQRYQLPGERPICWYGAKLPNGKLIVFDRSAGHALLFDAPEASPRIVPCPREGDLSMGTVQSDGYCYISFADPARMVRFDYEHEAFVDETALPWPEAAMSGRFEHDGILYCADSAAGRLLPLNMADQTWGEPIVHPDAGSVFGFIGLAFEFQGKGYFSLSTYAGRSRLDRKTGKLIAPSGKFIEPGDPLPTVDGRPPRFMERFMIYDPAQKSFDYLVAENEDDGLPLLCYPWANDEQFVITGFVQPWREPGVPDTTVPGHWLILQSQAAGEERGFERYDFNWDRATHLAANRRSYPLTASLFLPEIPHTPPIINREGSTVPYPAGKSAELERRAALTDAKAYWRSIIDRILPANADDATCFRLILEHTQHSIYYNPIQVPDTFDPIAIHEAHDGRCGHAVAIVLALCAAAGIEARESPLTAHTVTEAFYDGSWHYGDPLFFGGNQPARDGRVLSAEELKADPYFADSYPQQCFAYDPELLMSQDGFQVLGYVFGPWGSEPYYSHYLGAPKAHPPTLPTTIPARRVGEKQVAINWSPSVKWHGGTVEYEVRIFADRQCRQELLRDLTSATTYVWNVPEANRMYFVEVRAMDEHRKLQPNTWYPAARYNFVLAPIGQYGWYGVL